MDAARLRELVVYDPETGVMTRRVKVGCASAGALFGTSSRRGYLIGSLGNRLYSVHRLAWLYMTGNWPCGEVDHINGNRADNRWSNLRDVSKAENMQNVKSARRDNLATGLLVVGFDKRDGRYRAKIGVDGKQKYLGSFATAEEAHEAYLSAKRQLHPGCTL
jgi:hypothetical protein